MTRGAGAGEASLALRRSAYVGVGRRGAAGSLPRTRGPRVRRSHYSVLTHNQKSRAASAIEPPTQSRVDVAPTAFARDRRAAGQRVLRRLLARTGVVDDYFPRASQLSHRAVVPPSLTYTVNTAR